MKFEVGDWLCHRDINGYFVEEVMHLTKTELGEQAYVTKIIYSTASSFLPGDVDEFNQRDFQRYLDHFDGYIMKTDDEKMLIRLLVV